MDEVRAKQIVEAWVEDQSVHTTIYPPDIDDLISDIAAMPCEKCGVLQRERDAAVVSEARLEAELASARSEATAEALARAGEVAQKVAEILLKDAKNVIGKDELEAVGEHGIGASAYGACQAVKAAILALSPDPDYRSRIRGEVLEEAAKAIQRHRISKFAWEHLIVRNEIAAAIRNLKDRP